jgi:hypothetical protein
MQKNADGVEKIQTKIQTESKYQTANKLQTESKFSPKLNTVMIHTNQHPMDIPHF